MAFDCCDNQSCECRTGCLNVEDWVDEPSFLAHGEPCSDYVDTRDQRHEAAQIMFEITGRQYTGCCPKTLRSTPRPSQRQRSCACPVYGNSRAGLDCCQICSGNGTIEISGEFGVCPPSWLKRLTSLMAYEFSLRDHCPDNCRLPVNFTTLTRDGVTITRELGDSLLSWFRELDSWSSTMLAPFLTEDGRQRQPGRVFSPDLDDCPATDRLVLPPICCPEDIEVFVDGERFWRFEIHNGCTLVRTDGGIWPTSEVSAVDVVKPKPPKVSFK